MNSNSQNLARIAGVYAGVIFGIYWIPLRALNEAGFEASWAVLLFNGIPLVIALPSLVWRWRRYSAYTWRFHFSGCLIGVALVLYATSFLYTEVVRAVLLFYLTPIWGFLLARIFTGDRITIVRWLSIAVGFAGMLAILGIDDGLPLPRNAGDWMALGSGFIWACASLTVLLDDQGEPIDFTIAFFLWGTIVSTIIVLLATGLNDLALPDVSGLGWVLLWFVPFAMFGLGSGAFATVYSAGILNPGVLGILFMAEIIVATITASILSGEPFGVRELTGVLLVTLAGVLEPVSQLLRPRTG